jgi:hypothetical protein
MRREEEEKETKLLRDHARPRNSAVLPNHIIKGLCRNVYVHSFIQHYHLMPPFIKISQGIETQIFRQFSIFHNI